MTGTKRLTPEEREAIRKEKAERLRLKGKAMIARAKQIESKDKQRERKERTRELIEIGAILCQFHDRKKLLAYLKNPTQYLQFEEEIGKSKVVSVLDTTKKSTIFIKPEIG
jgi:predicted aconitase